MLKAVTAYCGQKTQHFWSPKDTVHYRYHRSSLPQLFEISLLVCMWRNTNLGCIGVKALKTTCRGPLYGHIVKLIFLVNTKGRINSSLTSFKSPLHILTGYLGIYKDYRVYKVSPLVTVYRKGNLENARLLMSRRAQLELLGWHLRF